MSAPNQPAYVIPPETGPGWKIPLLFVLVILLVAGNAYQFYKLNNIEKDLGTTRDALSGEIAKLRDTETLSSQTHQRSAEQLKAELAQARRQASQAAGQAKTDAVKRSEQLAAQLTQEQAKAQLETNAQITKVNEVATTANTKVGEVSTEVGNVKTDVASTKSELEKTIANLKRATGELSNQGSLIATNSSELGALRALGERNYVEFSLHRAKDPQKVGDISLVLKKADQKRNKYTVDVLADDTRVEKKDRTINEPVQFLTSKSKQPYEIVVNKVTKDNISGYLATPKVQNSR